MKLTRIVDGYEWRNCRILNGPSAQPVSRWMRPAYRVPDKYEYVFALIGLHFLMRVWHFKWTFAMAWGLKRPRGDEGNALIKSLPWGLPSLRIYRNWQQLGPRNPYLG